MDSKKLLPHGIAILTFFAVVFYFFAPQFQGKELPKGDLTAHLAASAETRAFEAQSGEEALWTGTSFAGMPNYQISPPDSGNKLAYAQQMTRGWLPRPAGYFFAGMLSCYLFLILAGVNPWLGIIGALGAGLATNGFVLYEAGHASKVMTVFNLPLIGAGMLLTFRKQYVWGFLIFALGMGLSIFSNHVQMLYYFGMTVPLYGIARLVKDYRKGELKHFGISMAILIGGLLLAVGAGAGLLMTTSEYTAETMRGGQKLETPIATAAATQPDAAPVKKKSGSGLEWDYAMQWSNGWKDILATYSPMAAGGGNGQQVSNQSAFGKVMRKAGFNVPAKFGAPMYHGSLPFTEGPAYLGAVAWALFIFGLFAARRTVAVWLGGGVILIFLVSMGRQLEGFNQFLFDNLPLLNKFRSPSSALSISTMMMVALGAFGVNDWLRRLNGTEQQAERARKQLLFSGVTAAVLGALTVFVFPAMIDFTQAGDAAQIQRFTGGQAKDVGSLVKGLVETRKDMYSADAWRSFLFVGLTFGALFLAYRKTFGTVILAVILSGLVTVDFAGINSTRMEAKDWNRKKSEQTIFPKSPADEQILKDTDPHYRVFNTTVSTFQDATTSYYHKSIGGYSAVKLRRIQDIIDGYLAKGDQKIISMLNGKYFIVRGQNGQPEARLNQNAYGPAWLAQDIQMVDSNDAEFAALGTTPDLKQTAIVHGDFQDVVAGFDPTGSGTIQLTEYTPNEITYNFNSDSEQLAVFSEIWYGPNLGWEVTVDGEPVELIRANYLLRAARIPAGQHTIKMSFVPSSYFTGRTLGLVCSLLIIFGILGYGGYSVWREVKG